MCRNSGCARPMAVVRSPLDASTGAGGSANKPWISGSPASGGDSSAGLLVTPGAAAVNSPSSTRLSTAAAAGRTRPSARPARAASTRWPAILSPRQVEILQGIADGLSTKQVARELGITQKTVHNHLNAIYRRLDTQSLTHAVLSAVRLGIIDLREA